MPTYYQLLRSSLVEVDPTETRRLKLYSRLLSALVAELPDLLGIGASSLLAIAARRIGASLPCSSVSGLDDALKCISSATSWSMEVYKWSEDTAYIIVRDCPIRQVCMFEGLPIAGTILCSIAKGLLEGLLSHGMRVPAKAAPVAHGPNACLYRLEARASSRLPPGSPFHIYEVLSEPTSEYAKRVERDLASILSILASLLEKSMGRAAAAPLRLSSRRYGELRSKLYPAATGLEEAVHHLSRETGLKLSVEGGAIRVDNCPLLGIGKEIICESMKSFIEGFLSGLLGEKLTVSRRRAGSSCILSLLRGGKR